jgi:hypothetical protein
MSTAKFATKSTNTKKNKYVKKDEISKEMFCPFYKGSSVDPKKVVSNMKRTEIFAMMKDPVMQMRNALYTRMCTYSKEECPEGEHCIFAHTQEQLRKPKCWFGQYCKKSSKECTWDHDPSHVIPEMPPPKPKEEKPIEKFIIPLDSDDEEEIVEEEIVEMDICETDSRVSPVFLLADTITNPNEIIVAEPFPLKSDMVLSRKEFEHYAAMGIDLSQQYNVIIEDRPEAPLQMFKPIDEEKERDQWGMQNPMKSWNEYRSRSATPSNNDTEIHITIVPKERKQRRVVIDVLADDDEYMEIVNRIKKIAL